MVVPGSNVEFARSPFENVFNLIGNFPQGHEKALKQALYNALALFLLFACSAVSWALYLILDPFVKPLIWGLLCGSVLHPFKYSISKTIKNWLQCLSNSSTPLIVGIFVVPLKIIDDAADRIGSKILNNIKLILLCISGFLTVFVLYYYTPYFCTCVIWRIGLFASYMLSWVIASVNLYVVLTATFAYMVILAIHWKPEMLIFEQISFLLWMLVAAYVSNYAGTFRVYAFFFIQALYAAGFLCEVFSVKSKLLSAGKCINMMEALQLTLSPKHLQEELEIQSPQTFEPDILSEHTETITKTDLDLTEFEDDGTPQRRRKSLSIIHPFSSHSGDHPYDEEEAMLGTLDSNKYLYAVFWGCCFVILWQNIWILHVLPILVVFYFTKQAAIYFGIWSWLWNQIEFVTNFITNWAVCRHSALFPVFVKGLFKVVLKCNAAIVDVMKSSTEAFSSITVILGLILFTLSTSIFLTLQVYAEGIQLVQMISTIINNTLVHNSQFIQLLPDDWQQQMDSVVDNAYVYGRETISKVIKSWLKDVDAKHGEHIESQILELWDRVYQAWMMSNSEPSLVGPVVTQTAVFATWETFMENIQKTPELFNLSAITSFARENLETLLSVLDSLWSILKGNLSLAFDSCTALMAIIFGGGTAVINFAVNFVVFLTALYYLLSSSGELYKPVEWITKVSPNSGNRFAVALEDAVASVFTASFKMAVFHGTWTWLSHNVFQVNIVYIPAVLAALLGAVPFLGTHWATVPAILELWFYQGRPVHAILLATCEIIITSTVDTVIYKEIRGGGHPYLTGLSIAGGIFLMGVEGAIVGPILLCGLFLALNMSTTIMAESASDNQLSDTFRLTQFSGNINRLKRMNSIL